MRIPLELLAKAERERYDQKLDAEAINKLRTRTATESARTIDRPEVVERRLNMLAAVAPENVADAFERYIGKNDLLPVNYLLTGYLQSRSVGLIRYFDKRAGKGAVATGFLISEDLLMTNHHVFPVATAAEFANLARDATIDFNAEYDIDGNHRDQLCFELDPDRFLHTSQELDMAVVAVRPTDKTGTKSLKSQGYLVLNPTLGKVGKGDFASIIQHPSGKEKQIAIRKNEVVDIDHPIALTYVSDTAQGSSGAPVFNDQWQTIALHSAGVPKKNARGEYLDEDDQVIETIDGRIDEDRIVWESNRGIRVSAMMNYLKQAPGGVAAHPLVQALFSPAYTDSRPYAFLSRPAFDGERTTVVVPASTVVPAVPALAGFPPVNISIAIGPAGPIVTTTGGLLLPPVHDVVDLEKKLEDEMDFSGCTGFDDHFMGVLIPMPVPNAALRQKLAFLTANPNAFVLKYHHFSTIHHAVRRVPVVSGINVDAKHRFAELDVKGSRVDRWYRDNRIDYDVQLNDDFYLSSGFDKGHMTRREDAEWGTSVAKAKLAADMTCSYANAAPQVPALNRANRHGRWGRLEEELLEKGIENESGKAARICVFNGPLFDDDDKPFKGVEVALRFYKVVVWYDGDAKLRTTCYELSQATLVGDIHFEVLRFDDVFKTSQVPIGKIEKATGLKFHDNIVNNDTSSGGEDPIE